MLEQVVSLSPMCDKQCGEPQHQRAKHLDPEQEAIWRHQKRDGRISPSAAPGRATLRLCGPHAPGRRGRGRGQRGRASPVRESSPAWVGRDRAVPDPVVRPTAPAARHPGSASALPPTTGRARPARPSPRPNTPTRRTQRRTRPKAGPPAPAAGEARRTERRYQAPARLGHTRWARTTSASWSTGARAGDAKRHRQIGVEGTYCISSYGGGRSAWPGPSHGSPCRTTGREWPALA